jgi:hypothetical protein
MPQPTFWSRSQLMICEKAKPNSNEVCPLFIFFVQLTLRWLRASELKKGSSTAHFLISEESAQILRTSIPSILLADLVTTSPFFPLRRDQWHEDLTMLFETMFSSLAQQASAIAMHDIHLLDRSKHQTGAARRRSIYGRHGGNGRRQACHRISRSWRA